MAYIRYVPYDEADADLDARYRAHWDDQVPGVDNILRIHGLNPKSLTGHADYYRHVVKGPSPLTRPQREMIAVVVSALNHCHY